MVSLIKRPAMAKCPRCSSVFESHGFVTCPACREKQRTYRAPTRAYAAERDAESRVCTICDKRKPLNYFQRDAKSPDGHKARCRDCATAKTMEYRRRTGVLPMKRIPLPENGMCFCTRHGDWAPRADFTKANGRPCGVDPWCKPCKAEASRERRISACECGRGPRERGEEACTRCLDEDGRTQPEKMLVSSLRVLGGEAQLRELVEDLGGDPDEDQTGAATRRAHRGLAALRKAGKLRTTYEGVEGASLASHRLKGGR